MLALASVGLWLGVPLGCLFVASLVQAATGNVGAGILAAFASMLVALVAAVALLGRLSDRHRALVVARGRPDPGMAPLELVCVCSAALALVGIAVWFVGFSHSAPLPLPTAR